MSWCRCRYFCGASSLTDATDSTDEWLVVMMVVCYAMVSRYARYAENGVCAAASHSFRWLLVCGSAAHSNQISKYFIVF